MSPQREWKTDGEIRTIFREESEKLFDRLVDGAQASINTSLLLHGDPSIGIKGFVPEMQERIAALEAKQNTLETTTSFHHTENVIRLERLEAGQGRMSRCMQMIFSKLTPVASNWKAITGVATAFGASSFLPQHWVKRGALWIWHYIGN